MEKLPLEIWWKIFDTIFEENPANLYQLRAVSSAWKTCIDQYFPTLFKKWHQNCLRDIPDCCMNMMVGARYPMAVLPWRETHWKTTQLPHIPKIIHQAWKNLPQVLKGHFKVTKIPAVLDPCKYRWYYDLNDENKFRHYPVFAINDKYLAVTHGPSDKLFHTHIYKLADLTQPIRVYPFECRRMDFYTAENREFIIFDAILSNTDHNSTTSRSKQTVYMSEFLKNDKLLRTKFWSDHYAIVSNECFAYRALHFEHYTFSNGDFEKNRQIILPKVNASFKWAEISELRIDDGALQVIIKMTPPSGTLGYDCDWWIFRYIILPDSNGKLSFDPFDKDFMVMWKEGRQFFSLDYSRLSYARLPMHTTVYLRCDDFLTDLDNTFNYQFISMLMHGHLLLLGTTNGKIFIYQFIPSEIMSAFKSGALRLRAIDEFFVCEINLNDKVKKSVVPIGVTYVNSKLRIIVLHPDNILTVDFPLTF